MNNKLYVGNLAFETTDRDLSDHFATAGTVTETMVITDKMSGSSRGFGFVTMSNDDEAETAIREFNDREFHGRTLSVNVAREREQRPAGGRSENRRPARRH